MNVGILPFTLSLKSYYLTIYTLYLDDYTEDVQDRCIRNGIMERAYNLKSCHRDRAVRKNADIFLEAMRLQDYSMDVFNDMHAKICIEMCFPSRALCLAIWRMVINDRKLDAETINTLFTAVERITVEDTTLNDEWHSLQRSISHQDHKSQSRRQSRSPSIDIKLQMAKPKPNGPNGVNGVKSIKSPNSVNSVNSPNSLSSPSSVSPKLRHSQSDSDDEKEGPPNLERVVSDYTPEAQRSIEEQLSQPVSEQEEIERQKSWLEKDLHIAILQTNPMIEAGDGGNLALNNERQRLEDIFHKTSRGLHFFFGVLTNESLIRCITRGVQILHISGHGPHAKALEVEDKFGNAEHLSAAKIKEAIEEGTHQGSASKKHGGLKLVFVSTCHSEWVAQSFCDAGVPHAVAVHSEVEILDKMATKFASAFYEKLIAQENSVEDAFRKSKAELLLEATEDCCCKHQGHKPECRCPSCGTPRCCQIHHGPKSQCANKIDIECCQPDVPHKHSDKFLLLPKGRNHDDHILSKLPAVPPERIECRPLTNIPDAKQVIVDRAAQISKLVRWLHPEAKPRYAKDAVCIYGRPKVGLTSLSVEVGRFFTRAWYSPIFPGGVFRVNLAKSDDPNTLFLQIAQTMGLQSAGVHGAYSYWDRETKENVVYDNNTQKKLWKALGGDITPPIQTVNTQNGEIHWILLREHVRSLETVRHAVPPLIYQRFLRLIELQNVNSLPMEFGIHPDDSTKVIARHIKFVEPDESVLLSLIQSDAVESEKLLVIDHINFPKHTVKHFLQKLKTLRERVQCRLLLVCSDRLEPEMRVQNQAGFIPKCKFERISPISKTASRQLFFHSIGRPLWPKDFKDLGRIPTSEVEMEVFPLFEWLSKSPALIQDTATALDRNVPFCVIIQNLDETADKRREALRPWQAICKWSDDERRDAEHALATLLRNIDFVRSIWKGQQSVFASRYDLFEKPKLNGVRSVPPNIVNDESRSVIPRGVSAPPQQGNEEMVKMQQLILEQQKTILEQQRQMMEMQKIMQEQLLKIQKQQQQMQQKLDETTTSPISPMM